MSADDEGGIEWGADWGDLFPPPPPPPSLGDPSQCASDLLHCSVEGGPMGAHLDKGAAFPSMPVVAVCSSVVLVAVLVASFLFWRHKSKVQNLLPCKGTDQQGGRPGDLGATNGVTYEDILSGHHPRMTPGHHLAGSQTLMPLEILDVKLGDLGTHPHITVMHHAPCYPPSREGPRQLGGKGPFHHPVYEEVSQDTKTTTGTSEEDFEDMEGSATSSVRGSTGGDLCRDPVSSDGEDLCMEAYYNNKNHQQHAYPPERTQRVTDASSFQPPFRKASREVAEPPFRGATDPSYRKTDRVTESPFRGATDPSYRKTDRVTEPPSFRPNDRVNTAESPSYRPPSHSTFRGGRLDPQWMSSGAAQFPVSASQENIYSTIDEDEDYPVTSLRDSGGVHPLSQRKAADENGHGGTSSYGDMMPAFHSATFM